MKINIKESLDNLETQLLFGFIFERTIYMFLGGFMIYHLNSFEALLYITFLWTMFLLVIKTFKKTTNKIKRNNK